MNEMISFSECNFNGSSVHNLNFNLNYRTKNQIIYLIIIGCVALVGGYIRTMFLNLLAERQIRIIRQTLFRSILKKDIEYFDKHKTGELSSCLTEDVIKIQDGMGDKLGTAIEIVSIFISCLIIGKVFVVQELIESKFVI
jgi:ABC-type multidrug transport system fused ATPase/permease subunit